MADAVDFTPYSTARNLMGVLPTWMSEWDAQRITAYQIYEQIYWNVPDTFKLLQRADKTERYLEFNEHTRSVEGAYEEIVGPAVTKL